VSESDKPDLARAWLRAEKLVDEEADRLARMSDEDFEREMSALPEPERLPTVEELLARATTRAAKRRWGGNQASGAKVTALPVQPRRPQWAALLGAAAIGGLVVAVVMQVMHLRETPVAQPRPHDDGGSQIEPTPRERAAKLREEAIAACRERRWAECENRLDEAKRLDLPGDADPRVQAAHQAALGGLHSEAGAVDPEGKSPRR
jgi:hypothetical protein